VILIVDDHPLAVEAITMTVSAAGEYLIISAASAAELHEQLKSPIYSSTKICAAFVDIQLPDGNGLSLLPTLVHCFHIPTVMMSALDDDHTILECIQGGASGFIHKSSRLTVYASVLKIVTSGGQYFPPHLVSKQEPNRPSIFSQLDARQLDLLELVVQGKTNKEIGLRLSRSEGSIKNRVTRIFEIFSVRSRLELINLLTKMNYKPKR